MRRSPFSPIVPFRGFTKPEWPYRINRDSQQAEDLRFWFSGAMPGSGVSGATVQAGPLDHVSGIEAINGSAADWVNYTGTVGGWGLGISGYFTWTNPGTIVYPTDGCTLLVHVVGASGATASFLRTNGGLGNALSLYFPYSDGNLYWDFGGNSSPNRISTSPTYHADDIFVVTAGARGSEVWQNGALIASQGTPITCATSGDLVLTCQTGSMASEIRMNGVQFSQALCQQMSEPQGRWDLYAPIRQRGWMLPSVAGSVVSAKVPYQPNYQWAPILAQ